MRKYADVQMGVSSIVNAKNREFVAYEPLKIAFAHLHIYTFAHSPQLGFSPIWVYFCPEATQLRTGITRLKTAPCPYGQTQKRTAQL